MDVVLFLVSALPVIILCRYIYKRDKNKEPLKLLLKLFLGGVLSIILVLIITLVLSILFPIFAADLTALNYFQLAIYVFIGIALVEEFCKWIITYFICYNNQEFEEIYDMIVYSVFVSLGFAFLENLLYVFEHGLTTGILRALLSVPGHAAYGIMMGYYFGLAKKHSVLGNKGQVRKYISLSIIVPVILHGIYDYLLFAQSEIALVIFAAFMIFIYIMSFITVNNVAKENRKFWQTVRLPKIIPSNYCPKCGHKVIGAYCPICGRKID